MPEQAAFNFSIVAPDRVIAKGPAQFVAIPGHDGEFGILRARSPLLAKLRPGLVRVRRGDDEQWYFIAGGFAQVVEDQLMILTPRAATRDEAIRMDIDALRVEASRLHVTDEASATRLSDAYAQIHALTRLVTRTPEHR